MMPLRFLLILLFCSGCTDSRPLATQQEERVHEISDSYFFSFPIDTFTSSHLPCVSLKLEGRVFPVILDLGFRGELSFLKDVVETIQEKTFLYDRKLWGFGGKEYLSKVYQIPAMRIDEITFSNLTIKEESREFRENSCLKKTGKPHSSLEKGKIGWEFFEEFNLLLDLGNESIAICDSLETLKKRGYFAEPFVTVPLWTERGFIEFEVETSKGSLRCALDSGCTHNVLHNDHPEVDLEETIDDPLFRINGKDFKPQWFLHLPIRLPIVVEAFLGMDFLIDHIVFIEFTTGKIHIAPKQSKT